MAESIQIQNDSLQLGFRLAIGVAYGAFHLLVISPAMCYRNGSCWPLFLEDVNTVNEGLWRDREGHVMHMTGDALGILASIHVTVI